MEQKAPNSEFKTSDSLALNKLVIKSSVPDGVILNNIAIEIINENISFFFCDNFWVRKIWDD